MSELAVQKCVACRSDAPKVTELEMAEMKPMIPDWNIFNRDGIDRLERKFVFKNFKEAIAFTIKVGDLAEAEGHHPAILTEWGSVTVTWWTHKIKGLHRNDFIMCAKIDDLYSS